MFTPIPVRNWELTYISLGNKLVNDIKIKHKFTNKNIYIDKQLLIFLKNTNLKSILKPEVCVCKEVCLRFHEWHAAPTKFYLYV